MKILILGASGMLGSTLARFLSRKVGFRVTGSCRSLENIDFLNIGGNLNLLYGVDVSNFSLLEEIIKLVTNYLLVH